MHMLERTFAGLAAAAVLTLGSAAHAAVFAINFQGGNLDETGSGGLYWHGTSGNSPAITNLLSATDGTTLTGVSMSTLNAGSFTSGDRGANLPITENSITFPAVVNRSYLADNLGSGRDGLMVFRFTAPNAPEFQVWDFTIVASYNHNNPGDNIHVIKYNVGGTYSSISKDFTGGTTLTLDASLGTANIDAGVLTAHATFNGTNYIIDLQVGYAGSGTGSVGPINALHVRTLIPEPASLVLLGLGGLCMLGGRARRR